MADIRTYASSLLKGMRLLQLFTSERPEWGVGELSKALGVAKSTGSRIAKTLESEGFLVRGGNASRYRLGFTLWQLGRHVVAERNDFRERARPYLNEIVGSVKESAHAVVLDDAEVLYVEKVLAKRALQTLTGLGGRYPWHCSSTGRAIVAFQPQTRVEAVLRNRLAPYTSFSNTSPARLRQDLDHVRERGFAIVKGEWRTDIGGIAAPVRDYSGEAFGALGVTIPLNRYPNDPGAMASAIVKAANRLSRDFGFVDTAQSVS